MTKFIMGIDVGTTGCKTSLFTEYGEQVARAYREYTLLRKKREVEISPFTWWEAVTATIKESIKKARIKSNQILGIGISGTNALIAVNKNGVPLGNAIMQMDNRSFSQVNWLNKSLKEKVFNITGNRIASGIFLAPKILWIKENKTNIYEETYKFLIPTGYIAYKLTNNFSIDYSRASTTLLFDIKKRCWCEELCEAMSISISKLPELFNSWEVIGEVTSEAAKETSLKKGTPVIAGSMDTVAAAVGLGVIKKKQSFLVLGTVGRVCVCLDKPSFDSRFINSCHAVPDLWLSIAAITGAGTSLQWFQENFCYMEKCLAKQISTDPNELIMTGIDKSPVGARGIIYIPTILGEQSPNWKSGAKGIFYGISPQATKIDFIRAILEGVAYAFRNNIEIFENLGFEISELPISGGGANNKIWRQIIADVTKKLVLLPSTIETETIGAAILAGKGVGIYKDLKTASDNFITIVDRIFPIEHNFSKYSEQFEIYKRLQEAINKV